MPAPSRIPLPDGQPAAGSPGLRRHPAGAWPVARLAGWLLLAPAGGVLAAQPVVIERHDPRLFGYQLGDVISEQVEIRLAAGYALDPQSLPRPGKRAGWFLVRAAEASSRALPDGATHVSLRLDMQLTNSPAVPRTLTIPEVALRFRGPQPVSENVPSLTIDAVPLGTGDVRTGMPDVRPPRPAPLISTAVQVRRLRWTGMAAVAAAAWLLATLAAGWLRPRKRRPFAQAQRELRSLLRAAGNLDGARAAVQRLHRAFDQAAGHRLFGAGVPAFCHRMGADSVLEQRTAAFFDRSQALFFASDTTDVPSGLAGELADLCRAWSRFEGRHP